MYSQKVVDVAKAVGKLKKLKRAGWVREGIENSESVADHSYRTALLAMVLAPYLAVDQAKLIKMALIHDVAESEMGDIVVERGGKIDTDLRDEKEKKEKEIVKNMFVNFGEEYVELFDEFISRQTRESQIMWEIDKLERTIQASEYKEEQQKDLQEFFDGAKIYITEPLLKEILEKL